MISKVIIGKTFAGCCKYVVNKKGAEILCANGVRQDTLPHTISDFQAVRNLRPTLKNAVMHSSISFSYEDSPNISNEKMNEIAKEFQKRLGMANHQSICVRHHDAKHDHFHLIINRIGYEGEVASDRFIKNRAARACDDLEMEYNLTVARGHGHSTSIKHRSPQKEQVKNQIKSAVQNGLASGIKNFDALNSYLCKQGIEMRVQYQTTGRVNGVSFKMDNMAFKGSAIDKTFSYKGLSGQMSMGINLLSHIENKLTNHKQLDYER